MVDGQINSTSSMDNTNAICTYIWTCTACVIRQNVVLNFNVGGRAQVSTYIFTVCRFKYIKNVYLFDLVCLFPGD